MMRSQVTFFYFILFFYAIWDSGRTYKAVPSLTPPTSITDIHIKKEGSRLLASFALNFLF